MDYLFLISRQALPAEPGSVSTEVHILPFGTFKDGKGLVAHVTKESLENILANFKARENDVVIDYEHQTLTGKEAPAAGWIKSLIIKDDGLWAQVEWTPRGEEQIKGKEYRYLSPVALAKKKDSHGRLIPERLHSAALTNDPAIDGMVPLAAKDHYENLNKESVMDEFLELLCKALGIDVKSTKEQVVAAVVAFKAAVDKGPELKEVIPKAVTEALGLKGDADASEVKATVLAMKAGAKPEHNEELIALKTKVAGMEANTLVCKAMEEGKVTADQKEWATKYATEDPNGFELFVAKAPKTVPMGKTPDGPTKSGAVITEEVGAMALTFGNSKADLVKYGGLQEVAS